MAFTSDSPRFTLPPGRVQSLNPTAWRTNSTFCSASSIQAMTDTSLVGRVLAIFGRGLGIRLYLSLHLRKAINRRHGGNVKRFAHRWKHRSRQIRYVDNTASPSETSYLGQRLRLPKQRSSANHSALLQALSFIPAVLRPAVAYSFVLVTTQVAT